MKDNIFPLNIMIYTRFICFGIGWKFNKFAKIIFRISTYPIIYIGHVFFFYKIDKIFKILCNILLSACGKGWEYADCIKIEGKTLRPAKKVFLRMTLNSI